MADAQHTPGPQTPHPICIGRLEAREYGISTRYEMALHAGTLESRGNCVAIVYMGGPGGVLNTPEAVRAFGERIVQCVNAHDDTLAALRQAETWIANQMLDKGWPVERVQEPPEGSHPATAATTARTTTSTPIERRRIEHHPRAGS